MNYVTLPAQAPSRGTGFSRWGVLQMMMGARILAAGAGLRFPLCPIRIAPSSMMSLQQLLHSTLGGLLAMILRRFLIQLLATVLVVLKLPRKRS